MQQKTKLKFYWQSQEHSWQELKEADAALGTAELWMLLCTHASSEAKHQVFFICNYFLSFFHLKFPEMLNFPNYIYIYIKCLIKTQFKYISQTIFQGGSPWATLIHNSMVCLRVHYCVQLLPEVTLFFTIPFTFSFAKVFSF